MTPLSRCVHNECFGAQHTISTGVDRSSLAVWGVGPSTLSSWIAALTAKRKVVTGYGRAGAVRAARKSQDSIFVQWARSSGAVAEALAAKGLSWLVRSRARHTWVNTQAVHGAGAVRLGQEAAAVDCVLIFQRSGAAARGSGGKRSLWCGSGHRLAIHGAAVDHSRRGLSGGSRAPERLHRRLTWTHSAWERPRAC